MPGRLQQQKEGKKQSLLAAANDLFLEKGVAKTSIDDIVKRAQVAKGTFYLYFKDKGELQQALVLRISTRVLNEAYEAVRGRRTGDFIEDLLLFIDHIIEQFKRDKLTLRLLERNFSWPVVARQLSQGTDPKLKSAVAGPDGDPAGQPPCRPPHRRRAVQAGVHHRRDVRLHLLLLHHRAEARHHRQHEARPLRYHPPGAGLTF